MSKKKSAKLSAAIDEIKKQEIPSHIAIIMDGNGRWAKKRKLPRVAGHKQGVETVREIVETSAQLGVKVLTLYTFSTENWKRPKDEVTTLMRLIVNSLQNETDELNKNNIRLTTIGDTGSLPNIVQKELNQAKEKTEHNNKMILNLALNYSGRWELIEAVKSISKKCESGEVDYQDICEDLISDHLTTKDLPDPDLMIRSSGEFRISNFLIWQLAYAELFVTETLWPDFNSYNLIEAIKDYQNRERRFGQVSEQIKKNLKKKQNAKLTEKLI